MCVGIKRMANFVGAGRLRLEFRQDYHCLPDAKAGSFWKSLRLLFRRQSVKDNVPSVCADPEKHKGVLIMMF